MIKTILGAIIGDIAGSRFEFDNIKSKDFELEHLKNSQQISKEDFEKYKLKQMEREVNVSDYEKYKLTQTLKELAGTVRGSKNDNP
jgi:hypothetical protein